MCYFTRNARAYSVMQDNQGMLPLTQHAIFGTPGKTIIEAFVDMQLLQGVCA